jgi:hypothetical protein
LLAIGKINVCTEKAEERIPADRADRNRKQRGSRALIGISVGRLYD